MKVLVTDPVADAGVERLRAAGHTVETVADLDAAALRDAAADAHALVVRGDTTVDAALLDAAPALRVVARAGVGVDNIDVDAATERGVLVTTAPEAHVRVAAEHTVAMTFATARTVPQAHMKLQAGEWAKSDHLGTEVNGRTLGVVGFGRVGQEVARRMTDLGMDVVAYDPHDEADRPGQVDARHVDALGDCLDAADMVTIHVPLTDETEDLIGAAELERLGEGHLINCSRGGIVDEAALAEAVADGPLEGAAVDVFADEPVTEDNPLLDVDRVVVTPHLSAAPDDAAATVATATAEQVISALAGEPCVEAINAPALDETASHRLAPYISLARTAGTIAGALDGDRPDRIQVTYAGALADDQVAYVTASALVGVLTDHPAVDADRVTVVNAADVAAAADIAVTERTDAETADFRNLVSVTVGDVTVSGTEFADGSRRIVSIDGYRVDAEPHGHMMVARNADEPGVIGFIGTVLGEEGVNIAGMFNARETIGGEALSVYNLDDPPTDGVFERLAADDRIIETTHVRLNGH